MEKVVSLSREKVSLKSKFQGALPLFRAVRPPDRMLCWPSERLQGEFLKTCVSIMPLISGSSSRIRAASLAFRVLASFTPAVFSLSSSCLPPTLKALLRSPVDMKVLNTSSSSFGSLRVLFTTCHAAVPTIPLISLMWSGTASPASSPSSFSTLSSLFMTSLRNFSFRSTCGLLLRVLVAPSCQVKSHSYLPERVLRCATQRDVSINRFATGANRMRTQGLPKRRSPSAGGACQVLPSNAQEASTASCWVFWFVHMKGPDLRAPHCASKETATEVSVRTGGGKTFTAPMPLRAFQALMMRLYLTVWRYFFRPAALPRSPRSLSRPPRYMDPVKWGPIPCPQSS
mmetsp:Transcript_110732/g.345085  ORF Transcript_110732/g.345085 Transcript_110732/m.345085 type:complete len:343 (-) Transcript_110732:1050-2078(-)